MKSKIHLPSSKRENYVLAVISNVIPKSSDKHSTYTIKDKQVWLKSLYQRYLKAEPSHCIWHRA